ncbi:MAG: NOL1/NOP2/sun family putative RNA methylase [Calditrichaeota bacterium]|nr:NOL1/NOP2/sun family putative RNA methylase [Calditrichota bacterium]
MQVSPELDRLFENLLGSEKEKIYGQIGQQLAHAIRFNPLKGPVDAQAELLKEQGFGFEPLEGLPNIYRITHQPYPIGKSLSHFVGHIYVQDVASMIPPLVLDPQPGEWVLDMSAAPGSKTTQMAAMMANQGVILANDVVMKRIRALINNLQRMGVTNTVVFKWFGEQFGNQYFEQFDRVLLDPACSGLGTLHKNPEVLSWWTPNHCIRLASSQRNLIISAIKALKPGGILTYSTCTLTPEENEEVIDFALNHFPVALEPIHLPGLKTRPGLTQFEGRRYHPDLQKAVRLYSFENDTEGFFIARLRKLEGLEPPRLKKPRQALRMEFLTARTSPVKKYLDFLTRQFDFPRETFERFVYQYQRRIVALSRDVASFPFYGKPVQMGLVLAHIMSQGAKLTTEGAQLLGHQARKMVVDLPDLTMLQAFVNRQEVDLPVPGKGQVLVRYRGLVIGYGLADGGRLKSQFPKGEWPFHLVDDS